MKVFIILLSIIVLFQAKANALHEITNVLEESKDFTPTEADALRPILTELQKQYDFIMNAPAIPDELDAQKLLAYKKSQMELEKYFENLFAKTNKINNIPSTLHVDLLKTVNLDFPIPTDMPAAEVEDLQKKKDDLSGLVEQAQRDIDSLIKLNNQVDTLLLDIDKPKVVAAIYGALKKVYFASVRVSRAAYCTYSYSPLITEAVDAIQSGKECYRHTISLLETMKSEFKNTISSINEVVADLQKIFKTISEKKTPKAKVIALINNFGNIKEDVGDILSIIGETMDKLQNDLPVAVGVTKECGSEFVHNVPEILYTVRHLTICITFRDEQPTYDFMKPEDEYYADYKHV